MKIAGLTLEEIAKTHKDNELVKGLVSALCKVKEAHRTERSRIIDLLLFGDLHEAPIGMFLSDKVDIKKIDESSTESATRMAAAATLRKLFNSSEV